MRVSFFIVFLIWLYTSKYLGFYIECEVYLIQNELFFTHHNYQLRQFTYLQSILLLHVRSQEILDQIIFECSYLPCLTHLTVVDRHIQIGENDTECLFDLIWSLPKIRHHHLDYFPNSTVISTSIRHLIIENGCCSLSTPNRLY